MTEIVSLHAYYKSPTVGKQKKKNIFHIDTIVFLNFYIYNVTWFLISINCNTIIMILFIIIIPFNFNVYLIHYYAMEKHKFI